MTLETCIRDAEGAFVLARYEYFSPMIDVHIGEALGPLKVMEWVRDLQLVNMDFEVDFKMVVDNIYGEHVGVLEFSVIIRKRIYLLGYDLVNFDVKFIKRQANEVAHSLSKTALLKVSFHIYSDISSYIESIIINELH